MGGIVVYQVVVGVGGGERVGKELAGEGGGGPETRSAGPREGDTRRRRTSLGAPDSST